MRGLPQGSPVRVSPVLVLGGPEAKSWLGEGGSTGPMGFPALTAHVLASRQLISLT